MNELLAIELIDGYKTGHHEQYPDNTESVYSNWTARGSRIQGVTETVHYGVNYLIKHYLLDYYNKNFFQLPVEEVMSYYKDLLQNYLGKPANIDHIERLHNLGYMPIRIRSLPEGTLVPLGVPAFTIENTLPDFFWLTNSLETLISTTIWPMCTVATLAHENRKTLEEWGQVTGADPFFIKLQAHDFSMRGMLGIEGAGMTASAHLLSGYGTDSLPALSFLRRYYDGNRTDEPVGISVSATEHSVMCLGTDADELGTIRRLVTETYPTGVVSIVSDTWNLWTVLTEYLPALKKEILSRDGTTIIRPDSGHPVDIICGKAVNRVEGSSSFTFEEWQSSVRDHMDEKFHDELDPVDFHIEDTMIWDYQGTRYEVTYTPDLNRHDKTYYYVENYGNFDDKFTFKRLETTPEDKGVIALLDETFGHTLNEKGYKVLNKVGAIYGDSITPERMLAILTKLEAAGYCSSVIVFGVGSFSYQYNTRDTFNYAMKATAGVVDGDVREIFKDPITGDGGKKSAKGYIKVVKDVDKGYRAEYPVSHAESMEGELETVFEDGVLLIDPKLHEIRKRLSDSL